MYQQAYRSPPNSIRFAPLNSNEKYRVPYRGSWKMAEPNRWIAVTQSKLKFSSLVHYESAKPDSWLDHWRMARRRPSILGFWATLWGLRATHAVHLRLIGTHVFDFLLALIEFISLTVTAEALGANINWK